MKVRTRSGTVYSIEETTAYDQTPRFTITRKAETESNPRVELGYTVEVSCLTVKVGCPIDVPGLHTTPVEEIDATGGALFEQVTEGEEG